MNQHITPIFHAMWLKLKDILQQLDQVIEMIVQETIDDLEKTYQQD